MEKGNNFRVYCGTIAFEKISKQIVRSIKNITNLKQTENEDQKEQVYIQILKVKY